MFWYIINPQVLLPYLLLDHIWHPHKEAVKHTDWKRHKMYVSACYSVTSMWPRIVDRLRFRYYCVKMFNTKNVLFCVFHVRVLIRFHIFMFCVYICIPGPHWNIAPLVWPSISDIFVEFHLILFQWQNFRSPSTNMYVMFSLYRTSRPAIQTCMYTSL